MAALRSAAPKPELPQQRVPHPAAYEAAAHLGPHPGMSPGLWEEEAAPPLPPPLSPPRPMLAKLQQCRVRD